MVASPSPWASPWSSSGRPYPVPRDPPHTASRVLPSGSARSWWWARRETGRGAAGHALIAALAGITDASAARRYLVKLLPGIYGVGASSVVMKPYGDIEGSGELVTEIRGSGSDSADTGTVVGADHAELRELTVRNTGGAAFAVAVFSASASPRLTRITVQVSGAEQNLGILNRSSAPTMTAIRVSASGGTATAGSAAASGTSPPAPSRAPAHDSGSVWVATPSPYDSFIHYTAPV